MWCCQSLCPHQSITIAGYKEVAFERALTMQGRQVLLSSYDPVYWYLCEAMGTCALVPPILIHNTTLVSEMTPLQDLATSGFNYDPISIVLWLSVVCVVLGITTIILAVYLCFIKNCKKPQTFDIHELPALGVRARQDMLKTSEVGSRNNEAFNTQLVDSEPPPPYTPYSVPSNSYCGPRTTP
ncbi:uncharacterized protein LOC121857255 isoform X2 [Homarus americanus]|uniref:uncharacterized protein LOC121857255 isoform X2 n=1 Tax=Homarus americanus TaxID=6706 RepID=UPI001C49635E|nr:uncharacterized protein LOC121857255 isoform X2 [Homarus americanus]